MNILLHVCCGPCSVYPLERLRSEGHQVHGYFYNPNIHPYREFKRRLNTLLDFCDRTGFQAEIERNYGLTGYLRQVVYNEDRRCSICYDMRLEATARLAAQQGAEGFTSTLLYSKYQNHQLLREKGERLADQYRLKFYYHDFREGWQQGIDGSIAMGLYRQPYCGCIYSEQERYDKKMRTKR